MKNAKSLLALAITSAALLAACNGTANITVPNANFTTQLTANGTARDVLLNTSGESTVQAQAATDLQPYRCDFDNTSKTWVVYYYSPSKKKSYRCHKNADKTTTVSEVTDVSYSYKDGQTIDIKTVQVDGDKAADTAAKQVTASASPAPTAMPSASPSPTGTGASVGATTTNNVTVNNIYLISAVQFNQMVGASTAQNPVWVCNVNNQTVYVDASTNTVINNGNGNTGAINNGTINAGTTTTVGAGTASPSPSPVASMAPSPMPSASASVVPSTTPSTH